MGGGGEEKRAPSNSGETEEGRKSQHRPKKHLTNTRMKPTSRGELKEEEKKMQRHPLAQGEGGALQIGNTSLNRNPAGHYYDRFAYPNTETLFILSSSRVWEPAACDENREDVKHGGGVFYRQAAEAKNLSSSSFRSRSTCCCTSECEAWPNERTSRFLSHLGFSR